MMSEVSAQLSHTCPPHKGMLRLLLEWMPLGFVVITLPQSAISVPAAL
jgi:hypothetical protein